MFRGLSARPCIAVRWAGLHGISLWVGKGGIRSQRGKVPAGNGEG